MAFFVSKKKTVEKSKKTAISMIVMIYLFRNYLSLNDNTHCVREYFQYLNFEFLKTD